MNHQLKVKLARKMQSRAEKQYYPPHDVFPGIFQSAQWELRKAGIATRVQRQQEAAHERAVARHSIVQPGLLTQARTRAVAAVQRRIDERKRRNAKYRSKNLSLQAQLLGYSISDRRRI